MFSIKAHDRDQLTVNDDSSSGGVRTRPYKLTKLLSASLVITLNFVDSWLKTLKTNYLCQTKIYCE